MGTMIPLGSVLGWIFAICGFFASAICFGLVWIEADLDDDASKRFMLVFVLSQAILILGVVYVVLYWGGGV